MNFITILLQTRSPYHRRNHATQEHKIKVSRSALQNRCLHTTNTDRSRTL